MNDYATAIHNSNERKERLANALSVSNASVSANDTSMAEWSYTEEYLHKHNLSIVEIIRSVAKKLHGVDIPPYNPQS